MNWYRRWDVPNQSPCLRGSRSQKDTGSLPDRVEVAVSRNIIKNVKSVVVPHTGGLRGIEAAAVAGIVAGDAAKELEVISHVEQEGHRSDGKLPEGSSVQCL